MFCMCLYLVKVSNVHLNLYVQAKSVTETSMYNKYTIHIEGNFRKMHLIYRQFRIICTHFS